MLKRLNRSQRGFTLIELLLAIALTGVISVAAAIGIHQITTGVSQVNNSMAVLNQARNAGYWVNRDGQMAESVYVNNSDPVNFLIFKWTEWSDVQSPIYHTACYSIQDLSGAMGKLKRTHTATDGTNEQMLVAESIYYDLAQSDTTEANYESPKLTVQVTTIAGDARETTQFEVMRRPNF